MTGREKIEAALSKDGTREIPAVICYEGIYVRDHWDQLTSRPWWHRYLPDLEQQLEWHRDVIDRTGQDWFSLPTSSTREERQNLDIQDRPDGVFQIDKSTGKTAPLTRPEIGGWSPSGQLHSVRPHRPVETVEEIDALVPLPPEFDANAFRSAGRADLADLMLREFGADLYPLSSVGSPLWNCYGLWGFEGMMTMVATRPDLVAHAGQRFLATAAYIVRQAAALGAAGIWLEECLTDMISPRAFAELNVPLLEHLIDEIHAQGLQCIYYYCGDPAGKWEHLLGVGADALSLEESKKGFVIDIEEVVAQVRGQCAVLGNLDAIDLLPNGTEAQLRDEIARQITAGRKNHNRFIMSLGSPVTPDTPVEKVRRYCELVHELGAKAG